MISKKMMHKGIFIFILFVIYISATPSAALEGVTHRAINEYIADKSTMISNFSFNQYLQNQLGFQNGSEEYVNGKKVFKWIGEGGVYEDDFFRYLNHFHNPITDQGLAGHYSALTWATGEAYRSGYSWYDVRNYYYQALTATDKANRDYFFIQTFQGLGQVMHMVQDMAVPAHTRGDKHPKFLGIGGDPYENWVMADKELLLREYYYPEVKA